MVTPVNGNKIAALQRSLSVQGMSTVKVVPSGALQGLAGIDSLRRLPNLHQELTDLIKTKFGIEVTDILCDREAKLEILGCNPPFIERVRNSNGNPGVLGHTVIFEIESETSGKLYFLKNEKNIEMAKADSPGAPTNNLSRALKKAIAPKPRPVLPPNLSEKINRLQELCKQLPKTEMIYYSMIIDWEAFKPISNAFNELREIIVYLYQLSLFPQTITDKLGGTLWGIDHDGGHGKISFSYTIVRSREIINLIRETYQFDTKEAK